MRCIAPTTSSLTRPVHAGSVERTTGERVSLARRVYEPFGESFARPGVFQNLQNCQISPPDGIQVSAICFIRSDSKTSPHYHAGVPQAFLPLFTTSIATGAFRSG